MDKPYHLSLKAVVAAARKAIEDGTLQALNTRERDSAICEYETTIRGKVCVCAIGAAMPPDLRQREDFRNKGISSLLDNEWFTSDAPHELSLLQSDHDLWVGCRADYGASAAEYQERQFMDRLAEFERNVS